MSQTQQLLCPSCGHHVADMTRAPEPDETADDRQFSSILARAHAKQFGVMTLADDELGKVSAEDMYAAYQRWAQANGREVIGPKSLGMALRAIGLTPYRTGKQRGYVGVRLKG